MTNCLKYKNICPIKFTATKNGNLEQPLCDEERCMWYDEEKEQCCILSISKISEVLE